MSQAGIAQNGSGGGEPIEFITGNSGGPVGPNAANNINLLGGVGINIVGSPGTNTLTVTAIGEGEQWQTISASQTLAVKNGYICTGGAALALALPAVSSVGDIIEITLDGSTSFQVTQGAGQSIKYGTNVTTTGAGGSLTSTQQGDSIRIVCSVANLRWNVLSSVGNLTTV